MFDQAWFYLVVLFIAIITVALVYFYKKKKVDLSAVISIYVFGAILIFTVGLSWLSLLLIFFIAGNIISRYGYYVKKELSVEEKVRTAKNVWGNGGAALVFAIAYWVTTNPLALIGYLGAVAAATADTFSTEVGQVHSKFPRLITKPKQRVAAGTSGGVSFFGLLAALVGSFIISATVLFFNQNLTLVALGTLAGFIGCNIDSILGATLESKYKSFNKHVVNLTASFFAGFILILISFWLGLVF